MDHSRLPAIVFKIRMSGFPNMIPNFREQELLHWKCLLGETGSAIIKIKKNPEAPANKYLGSNKIIQTSVSWKLWPVDANNPTDGKVSLYNTIKAIQNLSLQEIFNWKEDLYQERQPNWIKYLSIVYPLLTLQFSILSLPTC